MAAGVVAEDIYEAVFDEAAFANLPALLCAAGFGRASMVHWRHSDGAYEMLAYSYFSRPFMAAYAERYRAIDPWMIVAQNPPMTNQFFDLGRYVSPDVFERSVINQEFIRAQGDDTFHCAGAVFKSRWGSGVVSVLRGRRSPAFDAEDTGRLNALAESVGRVLALRGELAVHRRDAQLTRDALDALAIAAIVASKDGLIVQANAAAETVLGRADGLGVARGRLQAEDHASRQRLAAALEAATDARDVRASSIAVARGADADPLLVTVTPMPGGRGPSMALIVFHDPEREDRTLRDRLRTLFGLTAAEATLAIDLARGLSPPEIAAKRLVCASTIKTQLASIAAKTRRRRQAEITALLAALPPVRT